MTNNSTSAGCRTWTADSQSTIHNPQSTIRNAFTLVELMVIIVIIALLIGIAVPSIAKARTNIIRGNCKTTVHMLATACDQYKADHNEFPASTPQGRATLAQLLTGWKGAAADGEEGFGWRTGARARVYGPYNGAEKIPFKALGSERVFLDAFGNEIYYYRANASGSFSDGDNASGPSGGVNAYVMMGTSARTTTYAVMTAGPDGAWTSHNQGIASGDPTDDVTHWHD